MGPSEAVKHTHDVTPKLTDIILLSCVTWRRPTYPEKAAVFSLRAFKGLFLFPTAYVKHSAKNHMRIVRTVHIDEAEILQHAIKRQ